jgi:hypothetical protein
MTLDKLVEAWPRSAKEHNKLPVEKDHEDIQRQKSEITLKEDSEWVGP